MPVIDRLRAAGVAGSAEPLPMPAGAVASGTLRVPSSKSYTHRYLNLALLSGEPLVVEHPLVAEDTDLFLRVLAGAGWQVERDETSVRLTPGPRPGAARFECGNAGTLLRFVIASATTLPGRFLIDGSSRLRERPVGPLLEALRRLGAVIACLEREGFPPLEVEGGRLAGGATTVDAGDSSQFLSALLMAALAAEGEVAITVEALTSEPYVAITRECIARFGGRVEARADGFLVRPGLASPGRVEVEGDYSAACYPAAAAALTGGRVLLRGLSFSSPQGDRAFFELLARMGAQVEATSAGWRISGGGRLAAVEADLSGMPDQVPTLAALAPFARGTTRITGVPHLRLKESDRLAAMARELTRLGAEVTEHADGLTIAGVWAEREPPATEVVAETHGDHRIAMSLALVGLRRPGTLVAEPAVVAKSYPSFWRDLAFLVG